MKKYSIALLLSLAPFGSFAQQTATSPDLRFYPPDPETVDSKTLPRIVTGLHHGMPFLTARKMIVAAGWRPLDLKKTWQADESPDCGLLDCQLHRKGVIEVAGCPTDKPVCTFYYFKGKTSLQLMATGEQIKDLKIYYWSSQAPQQR